MIDPSNQIQAFDLPFPPSIWTLFYRGRIKTDRYKTWLNAAGWMLKEQRVEPIEGRIEMSIRLGRPDRRHRDLDNHVKAVQDLLVTHKIIADDSLIQSLHLSWSEGKQARVSIRPVP